MAQVRSLSIGAGSLSFCARIREYSQRVRFVPDFSATTAPEGVPQGAVRLFQRKALSARAGFGAVTIRTIFPGGGAAGWCRSSSILVRMPIFMCIHVFSFHFGETQLSKSVLSFLPHSHRYLRRLPAVGWCRSSTILAYMPIFMCMHMFSFHFGKTQISK